MGRGRLGTSFCRRPGGEGSFPIPILPSTLEHRKVINFVRCPLSGLVGGSGMPLWLLSKTSHSHLLHNKFVRVETFEEMLFTAIIGFLLRDPFVNPYSSWTLITYNRFDEDITKYLTNHEHTTLSRRRLCFYRCFKACSFLNPSTHSNDLHKDLVILFYELKITHVKWVVLIISNSFTR